MNAAPLSSTSPGGLHPGYGNGTVDIPAEQFRNWAGGFDTVEAAADFAASGGIPVTTMVSGGAITKIRLEHIWVEAAIDYIPSRGAQNRDADTWVALDPSFKQYEYLPGLDVAAIGGIDPEQLAQSFLSSGTVNEGRRADTRAEKKGVRNRFQQ